MCRRADRTNPVLVSTSQHHHLEEWAAEGKGCIQSVCPLGTGSNCGWIRWNRQIWGIFRPTMRSIILP